TRLQEKDVHLPSWFPETHIFTINNNVLEEM
ncbi:unnamed protein product, partial [marine sediment metagenome]